jgi:glycosyltransferase involved in cell wall biosynthesis
MNNTHKPIKSPTVSIVIPLFNEHDSIISICTAITTIMEKMQQPWELLLVNDGSTDNSAEIIHTLTDENEHFHGIHFSRNFGKEAALDAGLSNSIGDCIIFIDADMQHPPKCIEQMLQLWQQGYAVVNAQKKQRGKESMLYRWFSLSFNRIMSKVTGDDFQGATDFKLIDRSVADALLQCPERARFFRGLVAWVGFKSTSIEFDVAQRVAGDTKWSNWQLVKYSIGNIISFSSFPLIMVSWVGVITVLFGIILGIQTLFNFFSGNAISGFTTVIILLIFLCGVILLSLGIISLYIAKIYDEQKARPVFVIAQNSRTLSDTTNNQEKE